MWFGMYQPVSHVMLSLDVLQPLPDRVLQGQRLRY